MATAYEATIWVETDLRSDHGFDGEKLDALVFQHDIKETSNYDVFLHVRVNLQDGDSYGDVAKRVEGIFAKLVEEQKNDINTLGC